MDGVLLTEKRRASVKAIVVTMIIWLAVLVLITAITWARINAGFAFLFLLFLLLFPAFSFIRWVMFSLLIDQEKIQVVRTFIFRNKESLEFNKIEGVDIQQGPFGRLFNYGRLTISGVGIKQLRTEPIDRPDEVANEIRSLITRP